jgi:excisionase family DNA binding protein
MNPLDVFPSSRTLEVERPASTPADPPMVLTIDQAAERLCISRSLMFALVKAGEVETIRIGRLHRIPYDALLAYVESLRKPRKPHQVA